jgi:hypothetical protein
MQFQLWAIDQLQNWFLKYCHNYRAHRTDGGNSFPGVCPKPLIQRKDSNQHENNTVSTEQEKLSHGSSRLLAF